MSGIFQRISLIFRAKTDKALDKLEDPRQTLDYSYQRQLELLQKVRRGVADVATSRKRVELQANGLSTQADKLTQQAQKALQIGREDLAREALTRRSGIQQQMADLQTQHAQLQGEEEKLTRASQRLQAKVDSFRTRKETIKATYSAAEAQTRINEAFSGISEEMGDVGMAIQRAEDKTAEMQARAGAIDELLASGALEDPTGTAKDDITLELEQLASTSDVENELAQMKASLGAGSSAPQAIEGQPAAAPQQQATPQQQAAPQQPAASDPTLGQPAQQQPNQGDLR
ncbi:PspA/IM30 family protein [Microlunatus parietis]|uniref:Phage shock protein A n=1 Tax=Microlunatus parietis TaxID=682979 RepID=A0A7Y9I5U5_9ACTN|nr:PspA/IM30 family protein [Microlunatus parietis]NYE70841.1 phage shock protein A [Microlunatus parietis]